MSPERQLQPQFSFVIECTLARDNMIRYERVNCVGDNYSLIWDIANHHCRFLIKEGYRIVEMRLTNFQFFTHGYFLYYKEQ